MKSAGLKRWGEAPEPLIGRAHRRSPSVLPPQTWGVFEFVNEVTVARGSSLSLRALIGSFPPSPAPSSDTHTELRSAWCTT